MYVRALRTLQRQDEWSFIDARKALPKHDLNAKVKYDQNMELVYMPLEAWLVVAGHFQGNIEYGIKQAHGGEGGDDTSIYSLSGMPYNAARDLAEIAGKQLMQKFNSGWIEA
jgi:hypothetical protein